MPEHLSKSETGYPTPASVGSGTPTGQKFLRDDMTWQLPPGGSGTFAITEVEIDFSYPPTQSKSFTIVDAAVSTGSKILVSQSGNAPTDKNADDNEVEPIILSALPGNGSFTLYANSISSPVGGKFKVLYSIA